MEALLTEGTAFEEAEVRETIKARKQPCRARNKHGDICGNRALDGHIVCYKPGHLDQEPDLLRGIDRWAIKKQAEEEAIAIYRERKQQAKLAAAEYVAGLRGRIPSLFDNTTEYLAQQAVLAQQKAAAEMQRQSVLMEAARMKAQFMASKAQFGQPVRCLRCSCV